MSWAAASFTVLAIALAAGFAWYERSRPSARLLAVVGTLAALAILGRIAFAPVPNVKPTTDIVFIAGYALGGAPGFAVGAVSALGSNLFFGQGPWTPWQMGAWGLVGILGALVARASGERVRRVPLALVCGVAGLIYGVILDFSTWVTFSGDQTLAKYLAISAASLPFNIAHAVGNVVFFLAFGPGLIRAVQRCRTRFEIVWRPVGAAVPFLLAAVVACTAAHPARAADSPAARALAYLQNARNPDGGWGPAPGASSNNLHTAWAAYALAASGVRPGASTSAVLIDRLGGSRALNDLERTILGLAASGGDPRSANGRDLVAELLARRRKDGSFGGYVSYTSYGVLALRAVGESRGISAAARWVARQANRDGGFNVYRRGGPSNPDDTAGAVQALVAAGRRSTPTVRRAVRYLRRARHRDGGYALSIGAPTNAQSTAFAMLGLASAGADPGGAPRAYLRRLQRPDGSISYSRTSRQTPVWVTAQALLALRQKALPVLAPPPPTAGAPRAGGAGRRRIVPRSEGHERTAGDRPRPPQTPRTAAVPQLPARAAGALLGVLFEGILRASR